MKRWAHVWNILGGLALLVLIVSVPDGPWATAVRFAGVAASFTAQSIFYAIMSNRD